MNSFKELCKEQLVSVNGGDLSKIIIPLPRPVKPVFPKPLPINPPIIIGPIPIPIPSPQPPPVLM